MHGKKYLILIPVALAVALSVLAIYAYGINKSDFGDAPDYIAIADAMLNGAPYPRHGEFHPVFRAPVFPAFIALVWAFFPKSIVAFKFAQAFLNGASCWLIYKLAFELTGKYFPALLAAFIFAINPLLFGHTVDFYSEPLQVFLVALAFLLIVKIFKSERNLFYKVVACGIVFGLAALCRPTILPIVLCLVPAIFLLYVKDRERRVKYFFAAGAIGLSFLATLAPWTYYNYRTTGEFIPTVNGFGYNFWLGNHPDTIRIYEGSFASKEENQLFADHWASDLPSEKMKELEQKYQMSSLPFNQQERIWRGEAFQMIEENPQTFARLFFDKCLFYWTPFLNKLAYPLPFVLLVAALVIGLYIFSPYGAYVLWHNETGKNFVILLVIQFLLATFLHALIIANVRYRTPYVDPFLGILAAVALWRIAVKFFPKVEFLRS